MVKEHRFVFDPSDIVTVIYVCSKCHQEVHVPLQGDYRPSEQCGSCKTRLLNPISGSRLDPNEELLESFRSVLNLSSTKVEIRFVVHDHD